MARAGDIGKPLRRFTFWPAEVPVPIRRPPLPAVTEPEPTMEPAPERAPHEEEVTAP